MLKLISCRDASRICSEQLDRHLTLAERLSLRAHLMMCRSCAEFQRQMAWLRQLSRRYADGGFAERAAPTASEPRKDGEPPGL